MELILNSKHTERVSGPYLHPGKTRASHNPGIRQDALRARPTPTEPPPESRPARRLDPLLVCGPSPLPTTTAPPLTNRGTRALTETPRAGAHPFSSFEKTLQGREAVEESLYIRDKEAAAKIMREAELQAERLADASKAFKKEFSQELATMLHQKHLAERQKALRK